MVNVRIGAQIFEGVEKVKFDTTDGGTATFEEPADLTPIVEALEAAGVTVETADMAGIAAAMATIEDKIKPWKHLPNTGTDLLGDYVEVTVNYTPNVNVASGYVQLRENYYVDSLLYPPSTFGASMDLTHIQNNTFTLSPANSSSPTMNLCNNNAASRIILPEEYPIYEKQGSSGNVQILTYQLCGTAPIAVYLSKKMSDPRTTISSTWIGSQNNNVAEQFVKCPKDTEIPYFLNRMHKLTVDSMVGLFENLIDRSGETTVATLTLGSENLGRLTEEQKNIAYAKGWTLA